MAVRELGELRVDQDSGREAATGGLGWIGLGGLFEFGQCGTVR